MRLLALFLLLSFGAFAIPSENDIRQAKGERKLALLNEYLSVNSGVDARKSLDLIAEHESSLPIDMSTQSSLLFLAYKANALKFVGEKANALKLISEVIKSAEESNHLPVLRKALSFRSLMYSEQSQHAEALDDSEHLLSLFSTDEISQERARALHDAGSIYIEITKFRKALEVLLQSFELYESLGDLDGMASVNVRIGSIYRNISDFDNALAYQSKALETFLAIESRDEQKLAVAYNNTGIIYKDLGRYDEAIDMHQKSLALKQGIGYERGMVYSFNNLGETYRLKGELNESKRYLEKAESLATQLNNRMLLGSTYLYLGRIAVQESELKTARHYFTMAMEIYRKRNSQARIAEGLVEFAHLNIAEGNLEGALIQLAEAINAARASQKNIVLFQAYELQSELLAKLNRFDDAYSMLKTYQTERSKLFDLNSQQRIEMLVVSNQVNEAKRSLQLVKKESELTQSKLNHQLANRNLTLAILLSALLLAWYWYSRKTQKKQLAIEINARKSVEEKEQQLSLALWGSGDVLWDWDLRNGKIVRQNSRILAQLPEVSVGGDTKVFKGFVFEQDLERLSTGIEELIVGKTDSFELNYRVKSSEGRWLWVQDRGKVVERDDTGKAVRLAGIQHDISVLKEQEDSLVKLNNELENRVLARTEELETTLYQLQATQESLIEAEKMASLGGVVAGLAHEINTPIGTAMTAISHLNDELGRIRGLTAQGKLTKSILEEGLLSIDEGGQLVLRGLQRTAQLVDQFKKIAVTSRSDEMVEFKFHNFVDSALKSARSQSVNDRLIKLELSTDVTITSYIDALLQLFEILFNNILEHVVSNGELVIRVTVDETPEHYLLSIEDNGQGIDSDSIEHIFEPFYTTKRATGHVGLGLHIAYNLVTQFFKGEIFCERSILGGARFNVDIPKTRLGKNAVN